QPNSSSTFSLRAGVCSVSYSVGTLAFPGLDGCYLPKQENVFIHAVLDELDDFLQKDEPKSVLLFPPLPSRLRYLIHKSVESHPELSTFSVGEGWCRRVVVCFSHLRLPAEEDSSETNSSAYEAPLCRSRPPMESSRAGGRGGGGGEQRDGGSARRASRGARRPDQAIYVPRALRQRGSPGGGGSLSHPHQGGSAEQTESESVSVSSSCCSLSYSASEESGIESCNTDTSTSTSSSLQPPLPPPPTTTISTTSQYVVPPPSEWLPRPLDDQARHRELFGQSMASDQCPWPPTWGHTMSYFMGMSLEDRPGEEGEQEAEEQGREEDEQGEEDEDESAQSVGGTGAPPSTGSGSRERDAGDFTYEIISKLTEEDITIEHAQGDYSAFEVVSVNEEEFTHVIEIFGFPAMFKTGDLLDAFSEYSGGGMKIKWVDDTHALGVFSSETAAANALSIRHPLLKTRPLSQASKQAKGKAIKRAEFIQPVKERPRTDTAVARRMVTRALGLQRGGQRGKRY
ncbi:R3H and coiled-coil domain-containing protein 1, partial [Engraulis encrasicolus]|uniref:R3H and coiled-coil domain-containing protein 1 n=1 Tax=Engraulis encrasicolus TaxID=184585 RepID=UPI002FD4E842